MQHISVVWLGTWYIFTFSIDPLPFICSCVCMHSLQAQVKDPVTRDLDDDFLEIVSPPMFECATADVPDGVPDVAAATAAATPTDKHHPQWHPLLLFVPLRLGLNSFNPCYFDGLKVSGWDVRCGSHHHHDFYLRLSPLCA